MKPVIGQSATFAKATPADLYDLTAQMKVLIDECAPRALKYVLAAHGHECFTAQEAGWSGKENGELFGVGGGLI